MPHLDRKRAHTSWYTNCMSLALRERIRTAFAPPRYLSLSLAGIDISTSGIKAVRLSEGIHGLTLGSYSEVRIPSGAFVDGEIVDHASVADALSKAAKSAYISSANVALPESKSYLFETASSGNSAAEWRISIEQRLDELIPLPPSEAVFDVVKVGHDGNGDAIVAGIGFARRIVDGTMSVFDASGIKVESLEEETFSTARALLPRGDESTVLLIDIGRSTTKISIIEKCIPRFATTIGIGGHSLTLAVQKHFGVTEAEARKIKAERGIVHVPGNEDYLAAMLSTVSAIRD
jgi:type IV pilus assembly protein PilM